MRGFDRSEYRRRTERAQSMMADRGLAALFLTTEPEVRYFTGFLTRFWESPTRPWFLVLPAEGKPVAVIPSIGVPLMTKSWIEDIRPWTAPDLEDDGVSLLAATFRELVPNGGRIGVPDGHETHVRMPAAAPACKKMCVATSGHWRTTSSAICKYPSMRMCGSDVYPAHELSDSKVQPFVPAECCTADMAAA